MNQLLYVLENPNVIIQNSTLTENYISSTVYYLFKKSAIQLNNAAFIRNSLKESFLDMSLNCNAKLINNMMVENNDLDRMFNANSSYLGMETISIESNTFSQLIWVVERKVSFDSIKVQRNSVADG